MGGQALPEQRRSQSGRHHAGGVSDGRTDLDARNDLQPVRFPAPLAHGVRRFGMWLPTIEPSGSGLLARALPGSGGRRRRRAEARHLGVLGVTGWIQQDLSANPLDFTEAATRAPEAALRMG